MKSIKNFISESKNDNLHQFIQYIKETGKEGELKSTITNIEKLYNEAQPDKSNKFYSLQGMEYEDDFLEENGLDDVDDDYDGYIEYLKDICKDTIFDNLDLSKSNNGCIYIERALRIPNFHNDDKLYKTFKDKYDGSLGVYWTYVEGMGDSYSSYQGAGKDIIICALVRPEDVDWDETICANLMDPDEYELNIEEDSDIQIIEIKTQEGNHSLFKPKNLLYKA